jgi:flagellar hook-associated protein 1 FlgK
MSGIDLVLSIAKDALAAQQQGINVTAHNIANLNTPGYSRESLVQAPKDPALYAGFLQGRGVEVASISRAYDQFIESRLVQQQSNLFYSKDMESYMQVLEGFFNETSDTSISAMLADFWNLWQDIANNPAGAPERTSLYEYTLLLSGQFGGLEENLMQLKTNLTNEVGSEIDKINEITYEISQLNAQLGSMTDASSANDLLDKRNTLVSELSQYIDVKTFEQENGSVTLTTARGSVLVQLNSNYELEFGGTAGDSIMWQGSGGSKVDITNFITAGKLGASLEMRDETLAKYKLDLDAVAKEFIWAINQQHSQGVGLETFVGVTGTYQASDTSVALDSSGLAFADRILDGGLRLWLCDPNGNYDSDTTLTVDADVTSIDDIVAAINGIDAGKISATTVDGKLQINGVNGYTFAFSDDTSNALAALGLNTFLSGSTAGDMAINDKIQDNRNFISAAQITNNVGQAVANSGNDPSGTGTIVTNGHYTGTTDATYEIQISTGGAVGVAEFQWRKDGGAWSAPIVTTGGSQPIDVDGVEVTFMPGTYVVNDAFTINVGADSTSYGAFASGDNTNALAIAGLQYVSLDISQWTVDRINGNSEGSVNTTIEDYYHAMVASVGITSAGVSRSRSFNEDMTQKLQEVRDSVSAVSLDEEMTNLIEYQHAYAAAAKLVTVSNELLQTLIDMI